MKHIVTMALALCVALLVSACSSVELEQVEENASPVCGSTCTISAINQTVTSPTLPSATTHLCHPTKFTCTGAHADGPILQWGIPLFGGALGMSKTAFSAFPNVAGSGHGSGACRMDLQCDQWSNFHGTAGGVSDPYALTYFATQSQSPVFESGTLTMPWGLDVACFLSTVYGLSIGGEKAEIAPQAVNGWNWQLQVSGWRSLQGMTMCAWLGRPVTAWQFIQATPNNPGITNLSPSAAVCFITDIEGSQDDATVRIVGNPMQLEAVGQATKAKAACTLY